MDSPGSEDGPETGRTSVCGGREQSAKTKQRADMSSAIALIDNLHTIDPLTSSLCGR